MEYIKKLKSVIVEYVYVVSKQPVLYRDLLRANALYNEGMFVDPGMLNFRKDINRAYFAYGLLCVAFLIPLLGLTHAIFTNLDFHISILGTIFVTTVVCLGFTYFNAWIRDSITKKLIQEAWLLHFPYFSYEKYSKKVEYFYHEAMRNEVSKRDLEQFVLSKILEMQEK